MLAILVLAATANHYQTLGVSRDANAKLIKAAYHKIALKHHPDKTGGAKPEAKQASAQLFEQANSAFEVIGDPAQRRQYDFDLDNPAPPQQQHGAGDPAQQARRPLVEVTVRCTLEQLGGWVEAQVSLAAWSNALGATGNHTAARTLSTLAPPVPWIAHRPALAPLCRQFLTRPRARSASRSGFSCPPAAAAASRCGTQCRAWGRAAATSTSCWWGCRTGGGSGAATTCTPRSRCRRGTTRCAAR